MPPGLTLTVVRPQASELATPPPSPAEAPEAEDTGGSQQETGAGSEGVAAAALDEAPAASDPKPGDDADELQPPVRLWLLSPLTVEHAAYISGPCSQMYISGAEVMRAYMLFMLHFRCGTPRPSWCASSGRSSWPTQRSSRCARALHCPASQAREQMCFDLACLSVTTERQRVARRHMHLCGPLCLPILLLL